MCRTSWGAMSGSIRVRRSSAMRRRISCCARNTARATSCRRFRLRPELQPDDGGLDGGRAGLLPAVGIEVAPTAVGDDVELVADDHAVSRFAEAASVGFEHLHLSEVEREA